MIGQLLRGFVEGITLLAFVIDFFPVERRGSSGAGSGGRSESRGAGVAIIVIHVVVVVVHLVVAVAVAAAEALILGTDHGWFDSE